MKNWSLILVLFFFISTKAQNGAETCEGATVVLPGNFTEVLITQDTQGGEQGTAQPRDAVWYVFTPEEDGLLSLFSCDSSTDTRVFVGTGVCGALDTVAQSDDDCGLQSEILNLPIIASTSYYIEWDDRWSDASFTWSLEFIPASACQAPDMLLVNDIGSATVTLTWEEAATSSGYEWVVMNLGEDPTDASNTPVATGATGTEVLTATVTGLESNVTYDAFVRAICDTEESVFTQAVTFTTDCEIFIPNYIETFNEGIVPPVCWTEASNGTPSEGPMDLGGGSWRADDYLNDEVLSGGSENAARLNLFFNLEQDWLISPSFDLSGDIYELVYLVGVTDFGNQDPSAMGSDDEVQVLISIDDGVTWSNLRTYNAANTPSHLGQEEIIDLAAFTGVARFAFWGTDGAVNDLEDYDFFVDNFQVRSPLNCTPPEIVFTEIPDCDTDQFSININILSLGSSPSLVINDNFQSEDQIVDADGSSIVLGPYPSGTSVSVLVTGDDQDCIVTQNIQFSCPPSNDLCVDGVALIAGVNFQDQAITATNVDATDSAAIATTCSNYDGGDVWFTAVVPEDGILTIETNATAGSVVEDTGMEAYTGSCDALVLIECDDDDSEDGLFSLIAIDDMALAGETIFIRVWEWSNDAFGEFQISVYNENIETPCVAPEVSITLVNSCTTNSFSVDVIVNSLGSANSLLLSDDQGSEPQTVTAVDEVVTFGPFESGQMVTIFINGDDDECTLTEVVSFTCPSDNDFCQTAIPLITGINFPAEAITVSNAGATDSEIPTPPCSEYNGGDVWFSATVPPSGLLSIETNSALGSSLDDTAITAYAGDCSNLALLECDDNSSEDGAFSFITLTDPAIGGETIYIRVYDPTNDVVGDFQIAVYNENILSTESAVIPALSVYPNPVKRELTIRNFPENATAVVTNLLGQEIIVATTQRISVGDLEAGIYFITIKEGITSHTLRFIKN